MLRNEEILRTLLREILTEMGIAAAFGAINRGWSAEELAVSLASNLAAKIQEGQRPVDEAANVVRLKRLLTETFEELKVDRITQEGITDRYRRLCGADLATDAAPILARKLREG